MRGAMPPNVPSWLGAELKHRDNFTFCSDNLIPLYLKKGVW